MKKISKALRDFVEKARASEGYWIEAAKLHFAVSLDRQRVAAGLTYKDVADKLGTSAAYISKVFRGDTNVTVESMVKLARATGGRLDIQVVDGAAEQFSWAGCFSALERGTGGTGNSTRTTATIIDFPVANDAVFDNRWVA